MQPTGFNTLNHVAKVLQTQNALSVFVTFRRDLTRFVTFRHFLLLFDTFRHFSLTMHYLPIHYTTREQYSTLIDTDYFYPIGTDARQVRCI